jgi:6-phosphogluconolactonase
MNKLDRRQFFKTAGAFAFGLSLTDLPQLDRFRLKSKKPQVKELLVYVGTYTNGKSEGIYLYRMNLTTGEMTHQSTAKGVSNPAFLAIDPSRRFLYAANESNQFLGKKGGGLTAYAINQTTGALTKLNEVGVPGVPCHVSVHPSGKYVLAANYGGGNIVICPVRQDGGLAEVSDVAQHTGKGADPKRQDGPHAHCAMLDAAGQYAFAPDLGLDKVMIYKVDQAKGKLLPNGFFATKPAAGPRHFDFHPSGNFAYVINELDSTMVACAYDKTKGTLKELQTVTTLPRGFEGQNYPADIHVHPSGKFVYGTNRGHDSLVAFAIDQQNGRLQLIGHESTWGKLPRNFGIDPTGQFLLAANQNSGTVVSFRIDPATGKLKTAGHVTEIPSPVCVKFIPAFS